jgi:hypothetical protein
LNVARQNMRLSCAATRLTAFHVTMKYTMRVEVRKTIQNLGRKKRDELWLELAVFAQAASYAPTSYVLLKPSSSALRTISSQRKKRFTSRKTLRCSGVSSKPRRTNSSVSGPTLRTDKRTEILDDARMVQILERLNFRLQSRNHANLPFVVLVARRRGDHHLLAREHIASRGIKG